MFHRSPLYHVRPEAFRFNPWSLVPLFLVLGIFSGVIVGMLRTF